MLDTGLSYSMVPQEDISLIEASLKSQGIECVEQQSGGLDLYECSCDQETYNKLQPLQTSVGGK